MTYVAQLDTENFSFVALGASEDQAISAMIQTMRRHRAQYGPETWHPGAYPYASYGSDSAHDGSDESWLRWLFTDYYGGRVSGPYEYGMPGTRDGSPIMLRGDR